MKLLVSALEHSANIHLAALKNHLGDSVELIGIFDKKLGTPHVDLSALAIMGFVDALKKVRFFFRLKSEMLELAQNADKVLLIDSSGFNLPLAKSIKKRYPHKEIIYYILPQAWAWKPKRIPILERTIDKLCSILPFESDYYSSNAPIEYVGHPLLDAITHFKSEPSSHNVITFMPGSRAGEIKRLMPIFKTLRRRFEGDALVVIPPTFDAQKISELYGDLSAFTITHDSHDALYRADFAFICSGTATLEAALMGTPFVLGYIAKALDYAIAKKLVKLSYVGLGNIMFEKCAGHALHPELLQENVSADSLYAAYESMDKAEFCNNAITLRDYLKHGSSARMAEIILGAKYDN